MNNVFYKDWVNCRVNRIINILGKDWFGGKSVLELGACYGDIGMELVRYGADVLFTDARQDNLKEIPGKYPFANFTPKTLTLDQNYHYNLNKRFDLVLHFGTLCHVENWKQDLKCAMDHTNLMFLETIVNPYPGPDERHYTGNRKYMGSTSGYQAVFTAESVEEVLSSLGCKYLRIDSKELNTEWSWLENQHLIRHVYDWTTSNTDSYYNDSIKYKQKVHFRRMWLVIK